MALMFRSSYWLHHNAVSHLLACTETAVVARRSEGSGEPLELEHGHRLRLGRKKQQQMCPE